MDYRALPEFVRALARQQNRGADVCLVGMSAYLRRLFDVAGLGPALRRLEWKPVEEAGESRCLPLEIASITQHRPAVRRDILR